MVQPKDLLEGYTMSIYTISVTVSGFADGTLTRASIHYHTTLSNGTREATTVDLPSIGDGPYESPEDMLRVILPHVVEYI